MPQHGASTVLGRGSQAQQIGQRMHGNQERRTRSTTAIAQGAWIRPPRGDSTQTRQSPSSSRTRSTMIVPALPHVQRVLDGDLSGVIESYLAQKARTTAE